MDPKANLAEQLKIARDILDDEKPLPYEADVRRLAELVVSLHDWIMCGGYLPPQWQK